MDTPFQLELFGSLPIDAHLAGHIDRVCGVMFPAHMGAPDDPSGCRLPDRHDGPHLFASLGGQMLHWENDRECDCSDCLSEDANAWCVVYWPASPCRAS